MLQPGDQIDIWVIEKALGSGGMGSVYRCHNRTAGRILAAVKVLDSSLRKYPEAEARFIREAEILFQLDHPNIVKVRNVRTDAEPPYLEMEFVEGESLEERLRRGALPYDQAVEYITQMCSAVAYLHKKGVRHRDIKPANLLITSESKIKLVDFGLAMEADTTRITQSGMTFGTVSYAPPEWIAPDTLDPAKWDLYALGIVSYEMLTGRLAFPVSGQGSARQQAMQVIVGKQGHEPLDPGDQFHDDVRALVRDLTMADASKRVPSAAEAVRRSRKLARSLRRGQGVTLAPMSGEAWDEDGLDVTPERHPRPDQDTWPGSDLGAPPRIEPTPPAGVVSASVTTPTPRRSGALTVPPRASLGLGMLLGAGMVALFGVIAVAAVALFFLKNRAETRPVDIAVTGLPSDVSVHVRLDGREPTDVDGMVFLFEAMPFGDHELVWTMGEGCHGQDCPGEACPSWCGSGSAPTEVEPGRNKQAIAIDLHPPARRPVRVRMPKLEKPWPIELRLSDRIGQSDADGVIFEATPPGPQSLTARVGACPDEALGCWPDGTCPDGCISYRGEVTVPWGDGEFSWELEIPDPKPAPGAAAPKPGPRPTPTPTPQPAAGAGDPVTIAAYAGWLTSHPEWLADAAVAEGRAKAGYLKGWSGVTPPSGAKNSHAVMDVSWYAASAFCKSRGGLAQADDEPTRWSESPSQPYIELRAKGGQAAWRSSDGRVSTKVGLADVQPLTGFRCAK